MNLLEKDSMQKCFFSFPRKPKIQKVRVTEGNFWENV